MRKKKMNNITKRCEAIREEDKRMGKSKSPLHPVFEKLCREFITKYNKRGKDGNKRIS